VWNEISEKSKIEETGIEQKERENEN